MDDDSDGGVLLAGQIDDEEEQSLNQTTPDKHKRKREKQKANKKKKVRPVDAIDSPGSLDEPVNDDVAKMDPQLIADYVAQKLKRFGKDLSPLELQDKYISESSFSDTTSFNHPRTLRNLSAYLETFSDHPLARASTEPGAPHTIIITSSAIRATFLVRAVRKYQTSDSMVAKLFAKHIKLQESINLCTSTRMGFGVGTPGRIRHLLQEGVLKVSALKNIIVDASHVDKKKFGILDIRETSCDVMEILALESVKKRLGKDTRVLFY